MVKIESIGWLSKEALEAAVVVTDGQFKLLCFCQPFDKRKGERLIEPLHAFDARDIVRVTTPMSCIKKLDHTFDYIINGKLLDRETGYVKLGGIIIEIDKCSIPGDIDSGNYVSFACDRLDIY